MGKHSVQITDDNFYNELCEYCKINGLKISSFVTDLLKKQFLIEQYGDIPFGKMEEIKPILINDYKIPDEVPPVINQDNPQDSVEPIFVNYEDSNNTETITNSGITHPSVIWSPYTIEDKTTLITNGDGNLNKKYIKTRVPSDFYGEIKTESESKTQKTKKRRL